MPPCEWTVEQCGCSSKCLDGYSPATRALAITLATHHMWVATGRRYGPCELTVMPCNPQLVSDLYQTFGVGYHPFGDDDSGAGPYIDTSGTWRNGCGGGCTCKASCEVTLDGPVTSVSEVTVDGDVVPAAAYEVHDRHLLVRIDGTCWPTCQVYGTEVPGFTVTYQRGEAIPPAVQAAVEILVCEFAKACGGGDCQLPERLSSLTRQGVSVTVAETTDYADNMLTGIAAVDRVIVAENPARLQGRPQVLSPDLHPARGITWAGGS